MLDSDGNEKQTEVRGYINISEVQKYKQGKSPGTIIG